MLIFNFHIIHSTMQDAEYFIFLKVLFFRILHMHPWLKKYKHKSSFCINHNSQTLTAMSSITNSLPSSTEGLLNFTVFYTNLSLLNHGPTTNGLITGAFLWSHHDRRHLIMCILISTFMCHDNVDYAITNRHWPFTSLRFHFAEVQFQDTYFDWRPVDEEQRTQNYDNFCDIRLIITEADTFGHTSDLA